MTTYPYDIYDTDGWLAVAPPPQLGPDLCGLIAEVKAWGEEQVATVDALYDVACRGDAYQAARVRCDEATYRHPIGEPPSCTCVTTISPWSRAIRSRFGAGPSEVIDAVAARDHDLISPEDFATLTGWWADAGLPLPAPISDADRAALIQWWTKAGARVPALPR